MPHASVRGDAPRTDIQGLRAVAVSLVVVYHLFPDRLTGGFVGVDVFFVISGFLITSHLITRAPRGIGDLLAFWGRRIRRLLPASLFVLAVTMIASWAILPDTRWAATAQQDRAAALYVVNWRLAHDAVDYLAADSAASPVQHFWSLSVEEQFYLGWPILILVLGLLAVLTRRKSLGWYGAGLGVVVLGSFLWSIHTTATNPAAAYFVTQTRVWELGVGGLVAVAVRAGLFERLGAPVRIVLAWLGLAGIIAVSLTYTGAMPFPGWVAAAPVVATALVIAADAPRRGLSPVPMMGVRPVQWLGDVSYSVYLWHWPLIVLVPALQHHGRTRLDAVIVLVLTLLLAAASKRWIEDVFRTARWSRRLVPTYAMGIVGMGVVVAISASVVGAVHHREKVDESRLVAALASKDPCLGAGATDPERHCAPAVGPPIPTPALAAQDKSDAYADVSHGKDCWSYVPSFPTVTCHFGDPNGKVNVVLAGNSHAGQWLPALEEIAAEKHWRVTTYLASQCALSDVDQTFDTHAHAENCRRWADRTTQVITRSRPDLVVVANRISVSAWGAGSLAASQPLYQAGFERVLHQWAKAQLPVLILRDTPAPGGGGIDSIPDCVAEHGNDLAACSGKRSAWLPADPAIPAAVELHSRWIKTLDLTDRICPGLVCQGVVGGVIVYFDASHLTATYNRTLAPYLLPALTARLDG